MSGLQLRIQALRYHNSRVYSDAKRRITSMVTFIGKVADFFSCDKHVLNGVTLLFSFLSTWLYFACSYADEMKEKKVSITQVTLHVRKTTVSDNFYNAFVRTINKVRALWRFTETIAKNFLFSTDKQSWEQEEIINREPIRRFVLAFTAKLDSWMLNQQTHFTDFGLSSITVYRNRYRNTGTALMTYTD